MARASLEGITVRSEHVRIAPPPMTIHRLKQPVPEELPPAKLYIDDLEEILRVVRRAMVANVDGYDVKYQSLRVGDMDCDEIEDLTKLEKRSTREFVFAMKQGECTFYLSLGRSTVWRCSGFSHEEEWLLYHELEDIFRPRRYRWRVFCRELLGFKNVVLYPILFLIALSVLIAWLEPNQRLQAHEPLRIYTAIALTLLAGLPVLYGVIQNSTIVLERFSAHAAARRALGEKLIPDALKILIGFAFGLLADYLKHRWWP